MTITTMTAHAENVISLSIAAVYVAVCITGIILTYRLTHYCTRRHRP